MLTYLDVCGVPEGAMAEGIRTVAAEALPGGRPVDLAARLAPAVDAFTVVALDDGRVVGFKTGYSDRPGRFYSWLGGIAPDHRRRGIARALMRRQHARCRDRGYTRVRTLTTNGHKPMLILNLLEGFDVIGTVHSPGGAAKIVLEKVL